MINKGNNRSEFNYNNFKKRLKARNDRLLERHLEHIHPYEVKYGTYTLTILPDVFNPTYGEGSLLMLECKSHLHCKKVLDIGTGSGALAILAAERSKYVVATDDSPIAVECAQTNINQLNLSNKVEVRKGCLFESIQNDEKFDLIIFNPPFLKGYPKSFLEASIFDSEYYTLEGFFRQVDSYLASNGSILLCFGSVGDISYLNWLINVTGFKYSKIATSIQSTLEFFVYEIKRKRE